MEKTLSVAATTQILLRSPSSHSTKYTFLQCLCYAQSVDPEQSIDCPAQTVDARFAQTIHELSVPGPI